MRTREQLEALAREVSETRRRKGKRRRRCAWCSEQMPLETHGKVIYCSDECREKGSARKARERMRDRHGYYLHDDRTPERRKTLRELNRYVPAPLPARMPGSVPLEVFMAEQRQRLSAGLPGVGIKLQRSYGTETYTG